MADETSRVNPSLTRRRLFGAAAAAGGAAVAAAALPPNVRNALAAPLPGGKPSLRDIEHVVLIMQENRSFDHYYGTMSGVAGFSDAHALTLPTGRSVFYQPDPSNPDGYLLPFHFDTLTTSAQAIATTDHNWGTQHAAWNNGAMDSWLTAHMAATSDGPEKGPLIMGYYEEQDIPFHRALADAFTICDRYFCSILGPTTPNRVMWETGTVNPNGGQGGPILTDAMNVNTWTPYAESLTDAGVSWKFYQVEGGMATQCSYFKSFRDAPETSPLYLNSRNVPVGQFEYDAIHDRLPTVSWVFAGPGQSEHPSEGTPAAGAQFLASKVDAIAANPDVWAKTVMIIVYDENDGLFDHVPPPTPPAGTPDEFTSLVSPGGVHGDGLNLGAGFRVPCTIISPWTAGGWVCGEPFDHTSNLMFLEQVTGVKCPNISDWRRQTFGDFTSAFRFTGRPARPAALPDTAGTYYLSQYAASALPAPAVPTADQVPPVQAPGHRPVIPPAARG